jgi:formylglycine-generating enzyme required for sulfatase activity
LTSPVNGQQLKDITNSIEIKLVLIHAGSFTMGSPVDEIGIPRNETSHEVMLSKSYHLGKFEVPQGEYDRI